VPFRASKITHVSFSVEVSPHENIMAIKEIHKFCKRFYNRSLWNDFVCDTIIFIFSMDTRTPLLTLTETQILEVIRKRFKGVHLVGIYVEETIRTSQTLEELFEKLQRNVSGTVEGPRFPSENNQ